MSKVLVCGLINSETNIKVSSFPVEYCPIDYNFFGVDVYPSGVGLNLSLAFKTLLDDVRILSVIGEDLAGQMAKSVLLENGITLDYLMKSEFTAQSAVLFDDFGRRRVFCDLKNIQDKSYDEELFMLAAQDCDVLCLCNINFSRNLLPIAKDMNKMIACDVHCLSDINDEYNADFMSCADILFLSNENIIGKEYDFLKILCSKYPCDIIVIGMGDKGSLMFCRKDNKFYRRSAVCSVEVVNTVGAGDALFSSFVHFYSKGFDAYKSLDLATVFTSYKIGVSGASKGFVSENTVLEFINNDNLHGR